MPQEPDRYDLDEMMDRLNGRSDAFSEEAGELVTRADGRQAIRVKRRKRRSRQPKKDRQRRIRALQVSAALVVILLALLAVAIVTIYVNTGAYREELNKKLAISTGAKTQLKQFRMNPAGANAQAVELNWPEGHLLRSLALKNLQADVSPLAVLSNRFSGDYLRAESGKLVLGFPGHNEIGKAVLAAEGEAAVQFSQYNTNKLNIHFEVGQDEILRLLDTRAAFNPPKEGEPALLRMDGGEMRAQEWTLLRLDRAYIEFEKGVIRVHGLDLRHQSGDSGILELSGTLSPHEVKKPSMLQLEASSFLLSGLVGNLLGGLVEGRIDTDPQYGDSQLRLFGSPDKGMSLSMGFCGSMNESFYIQNLPVLYELSQIFDEEWISRPNFANHAQGWLKREGDQIVLSRLDMRSDNRMAIQGSLQQNGVALIGSLEIGIAPRIIAQANKPVLEQLFGEPREGFRWLSIEITGSNSSPKDNFKQLYAQAMEQVPTPRTELPEASGGPEGSSFEELTRPR